MLRFDYTAIVIGWMDGWMDGCRLATQMQFRFPQFVPTPIAQLIPNASPEGVSLMQVHTTVTQPSITLGS